VLIVLAKPLRKACQHAAGGADRTSGGEPLCSLAALRVGSTGGSRERLEVWQFYGPAVFGVRNRRAGQNLALGHSREPPATNR